MTNDLSRRIHPPFHFSQGCGGERLPSYRETAPRDLSPRQRRCGLGGALGQVIVVSALLLGMGEAQSMASPDTTLVLGVERDGRQEPAWAAAVTEHLGHNGESPVANPRLSSKDRECKGPQCLDAIAAREHARYILSLSVQTNAPRSFVLLGTLYDAEQHLPYQLPRPEVCDCSQEELMNRLDQVADELFKIYRKHPTASENGGTLSSPGGEPFKGSAVSLVSAAPLPETKPSTSGFSISPNRKIIAGVLGGVAVGTLAVAIGANVLDGTSTNPPCGSSRPMPQCIWDTRAFYGSFYGATAALAIGVVIALVLPEKEKPRPPVVTQPAEADPPPTPSAP